MEARVQQPPGGQNPSGSPSWFQELRPYCVEISQLAIKQPDSPVAARQLIQLTEQLSQVLKKVNAGNPLTPKLAEYVFFPLSHIFRHLDSLPHLLIENCLRCLQVLVRYGWASELSADLARQLFSLLIVVVDGKPGEAKNDDIPEETLLEGFRTISALLNANAFGIGPGLTDSDFLPTTGHGLSVVLDVLEIAPHAEVQIEASKVIGGVFAIAKSQNAYEAFLPGTVSAFARLLATPTKYRTSVLAEVIKALRTVLTKSLADMRMEQLRWTSASRRSTDAEQSEHDSLFAKWAKASAAQIKIALGPVVKLQKSESSPILQALYELCISLLDECHKSLENCAPMLVETAITLSRQQESAPNTLPSLMDLISIYPELGEILKNIVYGWMTSLARQMQASDERVKRTAFANLTRGVEMMKQAQIESSTLEEALSTSFTDSLVILLSPPGSPITSQPAQVRVPVIPHDSHSSFAAGSHPYQIALIEGDNSGDLRASILSYLTTVANLPQKARVADSLLQNLHGSPANITAASFWLCFEMCKVFEAGDAEADAMLNITEDAEEDTLLAELYSFSVDTLSTHSEVDADDWRLDFIAMEVITYVAEKSREQFRPELIDVLFPIATFLGSDNEQLQQQAIATLNGLAVSCQYGSVSELLISNVDYLVNSVSLRLNSLDMPPSSIAVLTMMVRLSGPRLVPFLDDLVESIFAALENYHGYTSFVENLFSVLNEIVGSAVKADMALLTSTGQPAPVHRKTRLKPAGLEAVLEYIEKEKKRRKDDEVEDLTGERPEGPFKRFTEAEAEEDAAESTNPAQEVEKPASPPTYQLLLRIASLTQHYLTSPTPNLRRSLLDVLSIAAPVLGMNEDAFLPLVNDVWPVTFDRLYDSETFVSIEACHALGSLCAAAGDFLGSRFKTAWWDGMGSWCQKCKVEVLAHAKRGGLGLRTSGTGEIVLPHQNRSKSSLVVQMQQFDAGGLGQHASQAKLWEAVVGLLVSMVTFVRMEDDMFDEILELLADELEKNDEAREALEVINADAVWLSRFERGKISVGEPPKGQLFGFSDVQKLSPYQISTSN